jgi:hypothetical protein
MSIPFGIAKPPPRRIPYSLFIDDMVGIPGMAAFRNPPAGGIASGEWRVARSSTNAIVIVITHGPPKMIDFDFDLGKLPNGEIDTAIRFLKQYQIQRPLDILHIQEYKIHSENPEGRKDIDAFMRSWSRWAKSENKERSRGK